MRTNILHNLLVVVFFLLTSCGPIELIPEEINGETQEEVNTEGDELYKEQKQWFKYLCSKSLGGRYSGSDGIKKAADYISSIINENSLERVSFEGKGVTMENLVYRVKGYSDSTIVFGAHYDAYGYANKNPLPGADDNISGVAVLLMMIKTINNEEVIPPYSLTFCFFDGEEIGRYGSYNFVLGNREPIKLYVNVDTCGSEEDYELTVSYNSSYPELRDKYLTLPERIGALPIIEYAPLGYTTDCEHFAKNKIPFLAIGPYKVPSYLHSPNDDISHISFSKLAIISKELVALVTNNL